MYNRYKDIEKFVTDRRELKLINGCEVYISFEEHYDIIVDLEGQADQFEELKPFIIFLAGHICGLDNIAQQFSSFRRPQNKQFPYDLKIIYLDAPDIVRLGYWGSLENTVFDVVFQYVNQKFILKKFGMQNNIADFPSGTLDPL